MLDQLAVGNAPDVDRVHLDLCPARWDAKELARVAATVCVAPDEAVAGLEYVVRVDSKALERVEERRKDGDGAVLAGRANRLWLT